MYVDLYVKPVYNLLMEGYLCMLGCEWLYVEGCVWRIVSKGLYVEGCMLIFVCG